MGKINLFLKACLILIVITIYFQYFNQQAMAQSTIDILNPNQSTPSSSETIELSLKQAIDLAYSFAIRWNKEAKLLRCNSVDEDKNISGLNGKRKYWNVIFGVPDTNKEFIVQVQEGKIDLQKDITRNGLSKSKQDFIELSDIKYDSPQLLKKAKDLTELYPGNEWAKGYNFEITKATDSVKNIVVIIVYGWKKNYKKMKVVPFNATTGEYIRMQVGFYHS
ncbi:hypothetical protein [Peribacillus loiseleuriae]|uniref:hypothetical protein n=1 Tax=Peribacillus loiseleuriae TaxID=1679170 RepID=UPI003CFEEEB6